MYFLTVEAQKVSSLNLETFIINTIEDESINHYDRAYLEDTVIMYRLPFFPEMEDLDITISLIPVTGSTQFYLI